MPMDFVTRNGPPLSTQHCTTIQEVLNPNVDTLSQQLALNVVQRSTLGSLEDGGYRVIDAESDLGSLAEN